MFTWGQKNAIWMKYQEGWENQACLSWSLKFIYIL